MRIKCRFLRISVHQLELCDMVQHRLPRIRGNACLEIPKNRGAGKMLRMMNSRPRG